MAYLWTTLVVKDLEKSVSFYKDIVGLRENRRIKGGTGVDIVFLGNGETQIELMNSAQPREIDMGKDITLGFEVASLDEKLAELEEKGIMVHSGPFQPIPTIKFFYVLDPNGLKIQFIENL